MDLGVVRDNVFEEVIFELSFLNGLFYWEKKFNIFFLCFIGKFVIVYRDIKLKNILVKKCDICVIVDLGLVVKYDFIMNIIDIF